MTRTLTRSMPRGKKHMLVLSVTGCSAGYLHQTREITTTRLYSSGTRALGNGSSTAKSSHPSKRAVYLSFGCTAFPAVAKPFSALPSSRTCSNPSLRVHRHSYTSTLTSTTAESRHSIVHCARSSIRWQTELKVPSKSWIVCASLG